MERIIIKTGAHSVPCASTTCEHMVKVSELNRLRLFEDKVVVVVCECGKSFEVVFGDV